MPPQDELTRLLPPRAFRERADAALRAIAAHGGKASLVLFDFDNLGKINARYGNVVGDAFLGELADLLRVSLRGTDVAGRVGDDELATLLLDCNIEPGLDVAERVTRAAASHGVLLPEGGFAHVTLSAGVASWPEHGNDVDSLLTAAGRALAHVKGHGRDGVASAAPLGSPMPPPALAVERFVGRATEFDRFRGWLDAALAGDPSLVVVTGEVGVGKTTFVRQLEPTLRLRGGSLVTGHCAESDVRAPFSAWTQVLAGVARIGGVAPRHWRELPQLVPALGAGDARGVRGDKYALFEESATYLHAATAAHPMVVLLDDAQWADPGTWDLIEYLLPTLESERFMLAVTVRSDADPELQARVQRLLRAPRAHHIDLGRLTRDEVRRWVNGAFHGQDVGHEMLGFLYGHTEGNPLFVVQVLRVLLDEGAVWHDGTRWRWRPLDELQLPVAVNDLITRRLAHLSTRTRDVLAVCAVIGREFDVDLARATGITPDALQSAIDEAIRVGVLQPTALRHGERYAFNHATLGALLRAGMPPRRLRATHERVARALEKRTPDQVAEIAMHFDKASAGAEAFQYALLAADRAGSVYAQSEAMDYLRVAERHASTEREVAEVQARLAQAAELAGEYEKALSHATRALEHFDRPDTPARALSLRRQAVRVRGHLGAPATETLAECERLAAMAEAAGVDEERAHVLAMMSRLYERIGSGVAAERAAEQCVEIAQRTGDKRLIADALTRFGVCIEPDQPDRATEQYRQALELYRALGDPRGQAHCHNNLGIVFTRRGEIEYAERELTTAITLGRAIGAPDLSGLFTLNLGVICVKRGEYDRARELIGESLAQFAAVKNSERQLYALINLAHLDRERGEHETAAELYEAAESLARRIGHDDIEIGAVAGRALALIALGREGDARAPASRAVARGDARSDWFQGRELTEALALIALCENGRISNALERFETNLPLAEAADLYGAAWLAAEVAPHLAPADRAFVRGAVARYAKKSRDQGYVQLAERCAKVAAALAEGGVSAA